MNLTCERIKNLIEVTPVAIKHILVLATPGSNFIQVIATSKKTGNVVNGFTQQLESCVKG